MKLRTAACLFLPDEWPTRRLILSRPAPAQMPLDKPGQFTYDPHQHLIVAPSEALWWRDGNLAIIKMSGGEVLATFPFSVNPNVYLPVGGSDLRWNTFAPAEPPLPPSRP